MNNLAETMLITGGIFNLAFAIFHLLFWRIFRWKEDLASLTHVNRSIMQILNLCLIFMFLMMAYISLFHSTEMLSTNIGNMLLAAFSVFWFLRMVEQVVFFKTNNKISILFTLVFLVGSILYALPWFLRL